MLFLEEYTCILAISYLILFHVGLLGLVLNRENILKTIMSLEILLLSVNLNFILISSYLDDLVGKVFVIFILILSAVESAVGLAILVAFYDKNKSIEFAVIRFKNKNIKF